ncbi:BZ3500_MvSof-1268-A1-R1_Chr1-3g01711 [Microbotryum saponariae]|uniref:BZ3500_MvSof-1268-A1-R1_Chr1-3g01711 protein n=1 Tax=Microbotryum saponariae TaxID=289078 RepID=A0A2X0K9W5_9BASI|nr:BZ3500_MvSof-1268-A1-R1_Chr1-3g01711 [Microbotryum saponariae]SCZ94398.1 BZ3501_MvSof-1269-A2-R1_Chr1-3g01312 [Microbotryum saponariae]
MLMLKSLSVLIVAASAAHALQSPASASNLGERGLTDGITKPITDIVSNAPLLGGLFGGGVKSPTDKVKRGLDNVVPVSNSAIPVESLSDTESALNDVTLDHNAATPDTGASGLPGVGGVFPDAGLESLISGLHKRQKQTHADLNVDFDAELDLVRRNHGKASGIKSKVNDAKPAKPATFVKKSKKHPKMADKEHHKKHDKEHKEHKKHHPVA